MPSTHCPSTQHSKKNIWTESFQAFLVNNTRAHSISVGQKAYFQGQGSNLGFAHADKCSEADSIPKSLLLWNRISLCSSGWLWTGEPLVATSWMSRVETCATLLGQRGDLYVIIGWGTVKDHYNTRKWFSSSPHKHHTNSTYFLFPHMVRQPNISGRTWYLKVKVHFLVEQICSVMTSRVNCIDSLVSEEDKGKRRNLSQQDSQLLKKTQKIYM